MDTIIIQASNPNELKTQLDALIATVTSIHFILETSTRSFYLVVYTP